MRLILPLTAAAAVCLLCAVLGAQEEEEIYMPKGVQHAFQSTERDCPMCGWNPFKKRSNDKPGKEFEGTFKPGDTCPFCGGAGKVRDTLDWAGGYAEAYGIGAPRERSREEDADKRRAQDFLMAKKAAEVRAARNAVALLANARLNRTSLADTPTYRQSIEATVKGAGYAEFKSSRDSDLPYYIAKVRIPLWGVSGLSESLWAAYSKSCGARKHAAAPREELDEEYVIIIDARGAECPPHFFPRVVTEGGTVVYDITLVNEKAAQENGMARFGYIEEDVPFEKLEESFKGAQLPDFWTDGRTYADFMNGDDKKDDKKDGEEEKDKPRKRRKRKKINLVVKGGKADEKKDASVVVSEVDAQKMKEADEKTDSLKGGKVIILTDSRVAGKEGRVIVRRIIRLASLK